MVAKRKEQGRKVVVIGAGIVGVSAALWLQRGGCDVVLLDRGAPGEGASYGNGGVLASCSIVPVTVPGLLLSAPKMIIDPDSPLFLRWSYLPRLMPWLVRYLSHCRPAEVRRIADALYPIVSDSLAEHRALAAGTPAAPRIVASDYLYLYRDRAAFEADRFAWDLRRAHGFEWDRMERRELRDYDPVFGDNCGFAIRLADHGHIIAPGRYVADLADHVVASGGSFLRAEVTDFQRQGSRVVGLVTSAGNISCDSVVIAAGVWSAPLVARLGIRVPLESERGYHVELLEPSLMPRAPAMIAAGKFVVTPMGDRLRLAGIVEFGGLEAPPSGRPGKLLLRRIRQAMPDLRWSEARHWLGHRPAPSDSIPVIGPLASTPGVYLAFGHHHIGLTAGPKTGRLIADMILDRQADIDLSPYRPERFSQRRYI